MPFDSGRRLHYSAAPDSTPTRTPLWPVCAVPRRPCINEVRSFDSITSGLLALADRLAQHGCTHVAMEARVYRKPVWHIIAGNFELVLADAQHIRNVPGRKTDVNVAMWIADLLAHGLIRSSFVTPAAIEELRSIPSGLPRWSKGSARKEHTLAEFDAVGSWNTCRYWH